MSLPTETKRTKALLIKVYLLLRLEVQVQVFVADCLQKTLRYAMIQRIQINWLEETIFSCVQ